MKVTIGYAKVEYDKLVHAGEIVITKDRKHVGFSVKGEGRYSNIDEYLLIPADDLKRALQATDPDVFK